MNTLGILFLTLMANAAPNPFSYESARLAYRSGVAPAARELEGKWMLVGSAIHPGEDQEKAGYWEDGKFSISGRGGKFQEFFTFTGSVDAFGHLVWNLVDQVVGVESGNIYDRYEYDGVLQESFKYYIPPSGYCAMKVECKIIENNRMLLCANRIADRVEHCRQAPSYGTVTSYLGLVHK